MSAEHKFPQRLQHGTPSWVESDAVFHLRLRVSSEHKTALVNPALAEQLMNAGSFYHAHGRWDCRLFLLMPDHVHMLAAFPARETMVRGVGDWKRYTARHAGVLWQTNFFDHRIRHEAEFREKWSYILRNPVVKELCATEEDWPWAMIPNQPARRSGST